MDMHQLTDIFCQIDDFCNRLDDYTKDYMLTGPMKGKRGPERGIIETVIGHLKHCYQVWHTRHRSIMNALTHLVPALAAYTIQPLQLGALKMLVNWSK